MAFSFSIEPSKLTSAQLTRIRVAFGIIGAVAIIVGVSILVWPKATLAIVAWIFGIYFLVIGLVRLIRGITNNARGAGYRVFSIILGILLILGGVYVLFNPVFGVAVLAYAIGVTWVVEGIAALVDLSHDSSRWFGVIYGIISIVAGILVFFVPVTAAVVLVKIVAILVLIAGIVQLVQAFFLGRKAREAGLVAE